MAKKMLFFVCLLAVLSFCAVNYANAADNLEGTYFVKGWNPGVTTIAESYIGTLTIKKVGQVFQLNWAIANQRHSGVGFYDEIGKKLSVAWFNSDSGDFGEVVYTVEGTTLNGIWTANGDRAALVGKEILTKQ